MRGFVALALALLSCACGPQPAARDGYAGQPLRAAITPGCGAELVDGAEQPCVQIDVFAEGEGEPVVRGDRVRVHYIVDVDGEQLDSSHRGKPLNFRVGDSGEVIEGMHRGVEGMRVGERRRFAVPPALGYRGRAVSGVPPAATMVFLVELIERRPDGDQ